MNNLLVYQAAKKSMYRNIKTFLNLLILKLSGLVISLNLLITLKIRYTKKLKLHFCSNNIALLLKSYAINQNCFFIQERNF